MTGIRDIFKCEVCGNIVEVVHSAGGTLTCCRQPMTRLLENTVDAAKEKHVPVVEKTESGVIVRIGEIEHPMVDSHYIEWIEVLTEKNVYRKELKPLDKPEATFCLDEEIVAARCYCNIHGMWKA